jgi:diaminopimelate epimerase
MTRELTVTKHHGLGNDFLVAFHAGVDDLPALAQRLCDRRRGLGADGLLIAESEEGYAARMWLYNADGSRAEMSGNGIRCFAQAVAIRRGDLDMQRILTDAGDRDVKLWPTSDPHTILASVGMGPALPIDAPDAWHELGLDAMRPVTHLSLGNPHSVVAVDDVHAVDLLNAGSIVPHVNLEIVQPGPEPDAITMRVHERGAGITEACGTGATAAAWAAAKWGLVDRDVREITVHMDGGDAKVVLGEELTLIGPATYVGRMTVELHS